MKSPGLTVVQFTESAKNYEDEMDQAFKENAPKGKFSKPVMNALVTAYRDVQRLMGFTGEDLYPLFSEQVVTEFPAEFVRGLAMLAKAAEDYGTVGIDLSNIKDNAGVALLTSKVRALADDAEFAKFLRSSPGETETETETEGPESESEGSANAMDAMFASRARS